MRGLEIIQEAIQKIQQINNDGFECVIKGKEVPKAMTDQHRMEVDNELYNRISPHIFKAFKQLPEIWKKLILFNVIGTVNNGDRNLIYKDRKIRISESGKNLSINIAWSDPLMNFILFLPTSIGFYDKILKKQKNKLESALNFGKKFYYEDQYEHNEALKLYYSLFLTSHNWEYHTHIDDHNLSQAQEQEKKLKTFYKNDSELEELLDGEYIDGLTKNCYKKEDKDKNNDERDEIGFGARISEYIMRDWEKSLVILIFFGIIIKQNFSRIPYLKNITNPLKS